MIRVERGLAACSHNGNGACDNAAWTCDETGLALIMAACFIRPGVRGTRKARNVDMFGAKEIFCQVGLPCATQDCGQLMQTLVGHPGWSNAWGRVLPLALAKIAEMTRDLEPWRLLRWRVLGTSLLSIAIQTNSDIPTVGGVEDWKTSLRIGLMRGIGWRRGVETRLGAQIDKDRCDPAKWLAWMRSLSDIGEARVWAFYLKDRRDIETNNIQFLGERLGLGGNGWSGQDMTNVIEGAEWRQILDVLRGVNSGRGPGDPPEYFRSICGRLVLIMDTYAKKPVEHDGVRMRMRG